MKWFDEAAVVRWFQDTPARPTLAEAQVRLQREGRATRVKYPSEAHPEAHPEAHRKFEIAAP